MSHTSTVSNIVITDIQALRSALSELRSKGIRCSLKTNEAPRAFYKDQPGMGVAPYVIHLEDGRYDVGLYLTKGSNSAYEVRYDTFGGHVETLLGVERKATNPSNNNYEVAGVGKLLQSYAIHATINKAAASGKSVIRDNRADGTVVLTVNGY